MLCFCEHSHSPVVWAHYSEGHTGICLGFEIPDSYKTDTPNFYKSGLSLTRIRYKAKVRPLAKRPDYKKIHSELLFTKYIHWQYEEEMRLYVPLPPIEDGLYFAKFSENLKLTDVILGFNNLTSEDQIRRLLLPQVDEDVTIWKVLPSKKEFKMVKDRARTPA